MGSWGHVTWRKTAGAAALALTIALAGAPPAAAQSGTITTDAGDGNAAFGGDGGPAASASLHHPQGVIAAPGGGYYIADNFNHRVRKVDADGTIHTIAGDGTPGFAGDGGPATSAHLNYPRGLALLSDGTLLIADTNNSRIRSVTPDGNIHTVAGNGTVGAGGDGGPASSAQLCFAGDVESMPDNSFLIADTCNHRIRRVDPSGIIDTIAGTGTAGNAGDGGPATSAQLNFPQGVARTPDDGYVIADTDNNRIRKIDAGGTITARAGSGAVGGGGDGGIAIQAELGHPQGVSVLNNGIILIPDTDNHRVRYVSGALIATLAGTGQAGYAGDGGQATNARLNRPWAVADLPGGDLLIAEHSGDRVRRVKAPPMSTAVFVVNTTADSQDGVCAPSPGDCSLYDAITAANGIPTPSRISFAIGLGGAQTIDIDHPLPPVNGTVTIDGTTQPGYTGSPLIEITTDNVNNGLRGLKQLTVRGLVINGFAGTAIDLQGGGSNTIEGCYIGTTANGLAARPNGIGVYATSGTVTVGGPTPEQRNVISGNSNIGVVVQGNGVKVAGNYIGVNAAGTAAVPNVTGVTVVSQNSVVGGSLPGEGNVISGNSDRGVRIVAPAKQNTVQGNLIGTSGDGTAAVPNQGGGILLQAAGDDNLIGGTTRGARNVISGNGTAAVAGGQVGVLVDSTAKTKIQGNYIGVAADGTTALGNETDGVRILSANNAVGDTTAGAGNLISGNGDAGVRLSGNSNSVRGNLIGTSLSGETAVPNAGAGVAVTGDDNAVGDEQTGGGNLVSGNGESGIDVSGSGNTIEGNFAGTDLAGTSALANGANGVVVSGSNTSVGGTTAGAGNLVSGNSDTGVRLSGESNAIRGNKIGTDLTGESALGNIHAGVAVTGEDNLVGDEQSGGGNVISGNKAEGVWISGAGATGNTVRGNLIGSDDDGKQAVPNLTTGIALVSAPGSTIGGHAAGQGNTIAGNGGDGVSVSGAGNAIEGNNIGTDSTGKAALGNRDGIVVGGSGVTIGGTASGARNVISGNRGVGVYLPGNANSLRGNFIGTDATGAAALKNESTGVAVVGKDNAIGEAGTGGGNVISGNSNEGVWISGSGATGNTVRNNRIGTDATGEQRLANRLTGITLLDAPGNSVGGSGLSEGNVISGNGETGVQIQGENADDETVAGNLIGLDASGNAAIGNGMHGVWISGGGDNTIGGTTGTARNIISGNGRPEVGGDGVGVLIDTPSADDSHGNVISRNFVGTRADGSRPIANEGDGVIVGDTDNEISRNLVSGNTQSGIYLPAGHNTVLGNFVGTNFGGVGDVPNGTFGVAAFSDDNTIGDATAAGMNLVSGNGSAGIATLGSGNKVRGNRVGSDKDGSQLVGSQITGITVFGGSDNIVGGSGPGEGNVFVGNHYAGIYVVNGAQGTVIRGNYVGTGRPPFDGVPLGNFYGIALFGSSGTIVGGSGPGEGNVIGANLEGIAVDGTASTVTIRGNHIGVSSNGTDLGNRRFGIMFYGPDNATTHTIGGTGPGEGNTIAFNGLGGVGQGQYLATVSIRGNAIYSNDILGIDLLADRVVTPNDTGDADSGPNGVQNMPSVAQATASGGVLSVNGSLASKASGDYSVDLYASDSCDDSGFGEGREYLGSVDVTTDASGDATFSEDLPSTAGAGQFVTATATDADGNTSEFGKCLTIEGEPALSVGDAAVDENGGSVTLPVELSAVSAHTVTVDYATVAGTAASGADFESASGTLSFAPGETSKNVTVTIDEDAADEPDEQFTLKLSNASKATISHADGVVTIRDDDGPPPPEPQQPSGGQPSGGQLVPPSQTPADQRDTHAPAITIGGLLSRLTRAALLHDGVRFDVSADENVTLDVQLIARPRFLRAARSGDVVIARKKWPRGGGARHGRLKVLRKLRRKFTHARAELRLVVDATDAAGNHTRVIKKIVVRG